MFVKRIIIYVNRTKKEEVNYMIKASAEDREKKELLEELKEIIPIYLSLPKNDRAFLLNNAIAFGILRKVENEEKIG